MADLEQDIERLIAHGKSQEPEPPWVWLQRLVEEATSKQALGQLWADIRRSTDIARRKLELLGFDDSKAGRAAARDYALALEALASKECDWAIDCERARSQYPEDYARDVADGDRPCRRCQVLARARKRMEGETG